MALMISDLNKRIIELKPKYLTADKEKHT